MKIARLLPANYDLALLRKARAVAHACIHASPLLGTMPTVAIGLPQPDEQRWRDHEHYLKMAGHGVSVRHLVWSEIRAELARRMFQGFNYPQILSGLKTVSVPRDWGANFTDCAAWISLVGTAHGAIQTLRPTAHLCTDLSSRYDPYGFASDRADTFWEKQSAAFGTWRHWGIAVTCESAKLSALTSYAGVEPSKVMHVPRFLTPLESQPESLALKSARRVLWLAEEGFQHDFAAALQGIDIYAREGGLLEPVLGSEKGCGISTDPQNSVAALDGDFTNIDLVRLRTVNDIAKQLTQAAHLWSSRLSDDEGVALLDGAAFGLHLMAPDTLLNRRTADQSNLKVQFYRPGDPVSIASALHALEARSESASSIRRAQDDETSILSAYAGFMIDRLMEMSID